MVNQQNAALLLELAACDDLPSFRRAVEEDGLPINAAAPWYGRWWTQNKTSMMGHELRTPLMVAALYGSTSVIDYILSTSSVDVNAPSGSDSATALHCAAAGGAPSALHAINLLLSASADVLKADAGGRLPADVVAKHQPLKVKAVLDSLLGRGSNPELEKPQPTSGSPARKEYPVDSTLPDINRGVYGTDEFRMYSFKVKPCSRAYTHDWTECPFVHPGENARRRDPRKYRYTCVPCPDFKKGTCRNGDSCEYAHGVFESWLHPSQYRTRLCKDEVGCNRRVCFFAHKPEELRHPSGDTSPISSPRSPPLDLASAAAFLLGQQQPMSPSTPNWLNHSSRLKSDLELELLGLQQQQQQQQQRLTSAILNSKAAAFAKRSQSFVSRGTIPNSTMVGGYGKQSVPGWGSPDGKVDWAMRGEELSKFRRSASFGLRGGVGSNVAVGSMVPDVIAEEPDVSWVQSLVSDVKAKEPYGRFPVWGDRFGLEQETIFA